MPAIILHCQRCTDLPKVTAPNLMWNALSYDATHAFVAECIQHVDVDLWCYDIVTLPKGACLMWNALSYDASIWHIWSVPQPKVWESSILFSSGFIWECPTYRLWLGLGYTLGCSTWCGMPCPILPLETFELFSCHPAQDSIWWRSPLNMVDANVRAFHIKWNALTLA